MGAVGEKEVFRVDDDTLLAEGFHFFNEADRVEDNTVADYTQFTGPQDA